MDTNKLDEAVMALLHLTSFQDGPVTRAWKGHAWEVLDRLFERGWIVDPKGKAKSVVLTEEGERMAPELFERLFGSESASPGSTEESGLKLGNLEELLDCEGEVGLGRMGPVREGAAASEFRHDLALLARRRGESWVDLLRRLDWAVGQVRDGGERIDEVNRR